MKEDIGVVVNPLGAGHGEIEKRGDEMYCELKNVISPSALACASRSSRRPIEACARCATT